MSGPMRDHPIGALERFDALGPEARRAVLRHVGGCTACRGRLVAADPARIFALLSADELPAEALERLERRVREGIDDAKKPAGRRWIAQAASLAASVLLAAAFLGYLWRTPAPLQAAAEPAAEPPAGEIFLISSPGEAQVVDLTVGETQVVMIFDEALDL